MTLVDPVSPDAAQTMMAIVEAGGYKPPVNENDISNEAFKEIITQELYFSDYHIFDNPNEISIQHIDCMAKLVDAETIIIKQVSESSPEYHGSARETNPSA